MSRPFDFGHLVDLCRRTHEETRRSAARAVDTYLVTRNWLFGWYLVEYEDGGADRSRLYGRRLIERLSDQLTSSGLQGCSPTNLRKFREFYHAYPEIRQTLSVESAGKLPAVESIGKLPAVESVGKLPAVESVGKLPAGIRQTPSVESVGKLPAGIRQTPSVTSTSPPSDGAAAAIGRMVSDRLPSPAPEENRTAPIGPTPSDQFASPLAALSRPLPEVIALLDGRFSLGWSHYVTLLTIDRAEERAFYEIEAAQNQWSVRELKRQIASSLYERLALSRDHDEVRRLSREGQVVEKASDLVKDPLVLEFLGLEDRPAYSETELETAIIDRLQQFLLELGKGFLFEARQKRFTFDNSHFFVDLVFYNRLLHCYVLIDLKRGELTHQDLGQMQMYVNYFDRHVKTDTELPTVGIVLCGSKNDAVVELTLPRDASIYASQYQLYLPSKQELKAQLESFQKELGEPWDSASDG